MKKMKIDYKDYKVTYDNATGDLLLYKDEQNKIMSVVNGRIENEKELIEVVELVLKTVENAEADHLNSLAEKAYATAVIEDFYNPSHFN